MWRQHRQGERLHQREGRRRNDGAPLFRQQRDSNKIGRQIQHVSKRELETTYACAEALQYVARVLGHGGQSSRGNHAGPPAARHRYRPGRRQRNNTSNSTNTNSTIQGPGVSAEYMRHQQVQPVFPSTSSQQQEPPTSAHRYTGNHQSPVSHSPHYQPTAHIQASRLNSSKRYTWKKEDVNINRRMSTLEIA